MKKTLRSAEEALNAYEAGDYSFELVTVAQGERMDEYLECYEKLRDLGSAHIAIGGLLKKIENSARFINVRNETELKTVIRRVRSDYSPDWLFVLGAYHPSRHDFFAEQDVWGSDYKGWIFNYTHKMDLLQRTHEDLAEEENSVLDDKVLKGLVTRRSNLHVRMQEHLRE